MGACVSYGRPKAKHTSKAVARLHAHKLNKTRVYRSEAYRCPKCGFWHAGRIPRTLELKRLERYADAVDERLVGKLIQALKDTINTKAIGGGDE